MGTCFYCFCNDKDFVCNKTILDNRSDILYIPKGCKIYNNARLTINFREKCKDKLRTDITYQLKRNINLYIDFPCMLPSLCRTFDTKYRDFLGRFKEITNRFNANNDMCIAYIENPLDCNQYLPILPVFEIIQEILKEMELQYTVTFDRINYNKVYMTEENAVLLINIIQKEPQYNIRIAEHNIEDENDNSMYTII